MKGKCPGKPSEECGYKGTRRCEAVSGSRRVPLKREPQTEAGVVHTLQQEGDMEAGWRGRWWTMRQLSLHHSCFPTERSNVSSGEGAWRLGVCRGKTGKGADTEHESSWRGKLG